MEIRNFIYSFSLDPKATGSKIKNLRKSKKMTAEKLAETLLCSVKTVSSWETGTRFPSLDALVDLANLFDISVHSLMLPFDNCSESPIKSPNPNDYSVFDSAYSIGLTDDEITQTLFIREEYLIQRLLCDVFTNQNQCELEALAYALQRTPVRELPSLKNNTADAFWKFKKEHFYHSQTASILFNRILRGECFPNTLNAMDLFEKCVFLTMLCYFPEFRNWDCAKMLYETGARFIDCQFSSNAEKIKQFSLKKEQERLFNVHAATITSEEELLCFWGLDPHMSEERKNKWLGWLETPRYKDNPDYYDKKILRMVTDNCGDPEERKTLAKYYSVFDFIIDTVESLDDFAKRRVEADMCFEEYIELLLERGAVS